MKFPVILKSKLYVPKLGKDIVSRPEITKKLRGLENYPLTIIVASAGYGKTTALAQAVANFQLPIGWYTPGPEDDNVYMFSSYLAAALDSLIPGLADRYFASIAPNEKFDWKRSFNLLMSIIEELGPDCEGILAIDDWHLLQKDDEIPAFFDRFLNCKPIGLRVVIMSREIVTLRAINRYRAEGQILEVTTEELAFKLQEVGDLVTRLVPDKLSDEYIKQIVDSTEGWIMAIKLVLNIQGTLDWNAFDNIFEYLSCEILENQSEEVRQFLLKSSVPEFVGYRLCQEVLGCSPQVMDQVIKSGLFLHKVKEGIYRYHTLFREFLYKEAEKRLPDIEDLHRQLADFHWQRDEKESALACYCKVGDWEKTQDTLVRIARDLVYTGRGQAFKRYYELLPAEYQENPYLQLALGDEERFHCNYQVALSSYHKAEERFIEIQEQSGLSKANRGIGEIYLDKVEPKQAQIYLLKAYRFLDKANGEEKANILRLLSENKINLGKPRQAERYRILAQKAQINPPKNNILEARILLRTGRLAEAISNLQRQIVLEKSNTGVYSSFRETPLMLSYCLSVTGAIDEAVDFAEEGLRLGKNSGLPLIQAVAYLRLGHALLVRGRGQVEASRQAYAKAKALVGSLDFIRIESELMMGTCLLYSLEGNWEMAERSGLQGIEIATEVEDYWFKALLFHSLGIAAASCHHEEKAEEYFTCAYQAFEVCGDSFGKTVVYWWLSYLAVSRRDRRVFSEKYSKFTYLASTNNYMFLLERATFLGDLDGTKSALLIRADQLLKEQERPSLKPFQGNTLIKNNDDSQLKICTLGGFRVLRDREEISPKDWGRKDSLRLFYLFLTKRRSLLNKEVIVDYLWPEESKSSADRKFRNALYNLNKVLEPHKEAWSPAHYIQRNGTTYYFNLAANYWLDANEFQISIEKARKIFRDNPEQAEKLLQEALDLYQGNYLEGASMDEWILEERERLSVIYIKAAEILARLLIRKRRYEEALYWTARILEEDPYWESAYQLRIWCNKKTNNPVMVERVYRECENKFKEELGIQPSPRTRRIYHKVIGYLE